MLAAQGDIAIVAADLHLLAISHHLACFIDPGVHVRLVAAPADAFQLLEFVGQAEQVIGAGKQLAAKIGLEAVGDHRNVLLVDDTGQLIDLLPGQELGLIDDKHIDTLLGMTGFHHLEQITALSEHFDFQLQPHPGTDHPDPEAVVDGGCHGQGMHAPFQIVEVRLNELGRFA